MNKKYLMKDTHTKNCVVSATICLSLSKVKLGYIGTYEPWAGEQPKLYDKLSAEKKSAVPYIYTIRPRYVQGLSERITNFRKGIWMFETYKQEQ